MAQSWEILSLAERPGLLADFERFADAGWPRFMRERAQPSGMPKRREFLEAFADWQLALLGEGGVVAVANALPIAWDGSVAGLPEGIAEIKWSAWRGRGGKAAALCAVAVLVDPASRGRGASAAALSGLRERAVRGGLSCLLAPVRPTWKSRYPLTPIEAYAAWTGEEGLPFDPWLRTHARLGAAVLAMMPRALDIRGSVAQWEDWTGMRFPDSGLYVVPEALAPVAVDREKDEGRYLEPNVWMRHPC